MGSSPEKEWHLSAVSHSGGLRAWRVTAVPATHLAACAGCDGYNARFGESNASEARWLSIRGRQTPAGSGAAVPSQPVARLKKKSRPAGAGSGGLARPLHL